jgi:uncharacterized SAM-binding protein YcdF (DUF218 family)
MDNPIKNKRRKRFKRLILWMLLGGILYFCAFITAIHIVGATDRTEKADMIVVLGAGLRRDGRPGWALTRRAEMAADLWHNDIAPMILCTGAKADGYPRSEASACQGILLRQGVPQTAILIEESSRSTEENAIYTSQILRERNLSSVVLVSDSYHMLRAEWLFRDAGIIAYTSPVPASRINNPPFYLFSLAREFIAFHWYGIKTFFNIPVTYIYGI